MKGMKKTGPTAKKVSSTKKSSARPKTSASKSTGTKGRNSKTQMPSNKFWEY